MNDFEQQDRTFRISGTQINFYFHCKRQLWFFSHHINTEHESDLVTLGRIIHQTTYERERREVEIDQIKLDHIDLRDGVIHEVKKSDSWSAAHEWQLLYYLYVLRQKGVEGLRGELNYPTIKRTVPVELTAEKERRLVEVMEDIRRIIAQPTPPEICVKKSVCRSCSYFELCYV